MTSTASRSVTYVLARMLPMSPLFTLPQRKSPKKGESPVRRRYLVNSCGSPALLAKARRLRNSRTVCTTAYTSGGNSLGISVRTRGSPSARRRPGSILEGPRKGIDRGNGRLNGPGLVRLFPQTGLRQTSHSRPPFLAATARRRTGAPRSKTANGPFTSEPDEGVSHPP